MSSSSSVPERIADRYELRALLGSGAMGTVWRAWDTVLGREVAIKRVRHETGGRAEPIDGLLREASLLASLQHPNIVTAYDAGVEGGEAHLVMELVQGQTLETQWQATEPPDLVAFAEAAGQLLEGLAAAHGLSLIHRDFKPGNIMVTRQPSGSRLYKILDFGLARASCTARPQTLEDGRIIRGSAPFIAPEQLRGELVDARADLYAAGCVFYWMLTGRPAFDGSTLMEVVTAHLQHRLIDIRDLSPSLPPLLSDWVMSLMNPQPEDRYPSASDALRALRHILLPGGSVPVPLPAAETLAEAAPSAPDARPERPGRARVGLTVLAAVAVLSAGGMAVRQSGSNPEPGNAVAAVVGTPPAQTLPPAPSPLPSQPPVAPDDLALDPLNLQSFAGKVGRPVTVEGVVRRIGESKSGDVLYVNFSADYRNAASLVLFVDAAQRAEVKTGLERLVSSRVRASGPLEEYKGALQVRLREETDIRVIADRAPTDPVPGTKP